MLDFWQHLFDTSDFPARWRCGNWSDGLGWLHIFSDLGVWSAYVAIPVVLSWFVLRRSDLPFRTIFWLFGAFILACGTTHLMEAAIFWWPAYRLSGLIKLFTAVVSWATVVALVPIVPKALLLRSPEALECEINVRKAAEDALRQAQAELEQRVRERTADLALANSNLQAEVIERKRAQEQSAAADRLKDEFLANLSHELRTPLNAILGWSQLLRAETPSPAELETGLQVIRRNATLQARLVEDLLDVSRIVSGQLRIELTSVRLGDVIQQALAAIMPAAEARKVRLRSDVDPAAPFVMGDFARLQQVVWNLLANAVKFTPEGGDVLIELRGGPQAEIVVTDTGQGIAPEFLPFIFERFRQQDASTTRRHGGLGLGLSIVRHLVELHGGSVGATSEGPGRGSTFTVSLPASASPGASPNAAPGSQNGEGGSQSTAINLNGLQVLVVDDEPDARELFARVLDQYGAKTRAAGSAAEALQILAEWRPSVLVSDLGMPDQDGFDLIRVVRGRYSDRELPALALTAFARPEDRWRSLNAGYQMHVSKPVDAIELCATVASLARLGTNQTA